MESLIKEAALNELLDASASETVKMLAFKPSQAGMGMLQLASGEEHT
jgi:hypothetical protein